MDTTYPVLDKVDNRPAAEHTVDMVLFGILVVAGKLVVDGELSQFGVEDY